MKIAIAQINPIIADIDGNKKKILEYIDEAKKKGAELVVFPEMATIGYPPMDLLESKKLVDDNLEAIQSIAGQSNDIAVICGFVDYDPITPPLLFNSAAFIRNGEIVSRHQKTLLPSYDVFDEARYFSPAREHRIAEFNNRKIGITICEDIWNDYNFENNIFIEQRKYSADPIKIIMDLGADIIINISASPYVKGKFAYKYKMISNIAKRNSVPILYINQVGGNDSLIFEGNSFFLSRDGDLLSRAEKFQEDLLIIDDESEMPQDEPENDEMEEIRGALLLGLKDYVKKCSFKDVVIGLSGGIDSALTAVLAAQALGPKHVIGITMPSMYSSKGSVDDSVELASNLGIKIEKIPIKEIFTIYKNSLKKIFKGRPEDVTEENLQARIRGNLLMSVSNKFGSLLLTTGNKSELAMGYCTLYGDMSGGLAVIADLPKTLVYKLANHINKAGNIIPEAIITKAPSAELRENQKDQDSLPPYDMLDQILERYIEKRMSSLQIISDGFPEDIVRQVLLTVDRNEYKRRQAPPCLKITTKAFGIGRRIPIANKYIP